ncbi:unnamed protein product [Vicia faba]|uniref:Uncharacterized protein n=1 Tax=Vicia faba TaxID=3906 RepID=A0AAV0ZAP7_VICFA|nr:unnamed protein product [Vicia faba]
MDGRDLSVTVINDEFTCFFLENNTNDDSFPATDVEDSLSGESMGSLYLMYVSRSAISYSEGGASDVADTVREGSLEERYREKVLRREIVPRIEKQVGVDRTELNSPESRAGVHRRQPESPNPVCE